MIATCAFINISCTNFSWIEARYKNVAVTRNVLNVLCMDWFWEGSPIANTGRDRFRGGYQDQKRLLSHRLWPYIMPSSEEILVEFSSEVDHKSSGGVRPRAGALKMNPPRQDAGMQMLQR